MGERSDEATTKGPGAPPEHATIAVIGGGPGGSMTAALLAREGFDVVLCERETFPRYHIGESLLTSAIPLLKFVGLYERMEAHGFTRKHGGYFSLRKGAAPGHIDFRKVSAHGHSYQVIRSEFDELLLRHAAASGARVFEGTAVAGVDFDGDRAVALRWRQGDAEGRMTFDQLVDASGLAGLLTTRCLRNRRFQDAFANVAVGSYWRGHTPYVAPDGSPQGGDFYMEALADGSGWTWAVPLHDGTLSVGIVVHRDEFRRLREAEGGAAGVYAACVAKSPEVAAMLAGAAREGAIQTWQDFSYVAERFAGPGYRVVGDAAAFIDPLFSTGVHMAFLGALAAAASIASELRDGLTPAAAAAFHDSCVRKAYTRFAVIVAGMYKQIRAQDATVLYGVEGADFRRAFELVLPVLTGAADLGEGDVSPEVLGRAIDFTIDMMNERAQLGSDNRAAQLFVAEAGVHEDLAAAPENAIDGRFIRLERGRLGLVEVGSQADEIDRRRDDLRARLTLASRS
ncbi:MAG: NAD(P)/FAD-dependent oxidoreductase [Nannocystaceae bacterium]